MGWFENQIEERRLADQQLLEDSFIRVAGVVLGDRGAGRIVDERIITKNCIDEILKYYHLKPVEVPESISSSLEQLEYCMRPNGLMYRDVELTEGWYKDSYGPFLGFIKESGMPVALLPDRFTGYYYIDPESGQKIRVGRKNEALIDTDAICFYRPFPRKQLGIKDLLIYAKNCVTANDIGLLVTVTVAVTFVNMLMPRITKAITGPVLASGRYDALIGIAICIVCVAVSSQLITVIQGLFQMRITTKTSIGVQSAMMMRLMTLPARFFGSYSPGELRNRSLAVDTLSSMLTNMLFATGLTSLTSLLYITQIFSFAPALVVPSLVIILVTTLVSIASTMVQVGINRKQMKIAAKESGVSLSLITGIQKIKLAGAEKRVFAKWLDLYSQDAELTFNPPMFIKVNSVITTGIGLFSTIILYYIAAKNNMDASSYFAFMSSYGLLMTAFMTLASMALPLAQIRPVLEMAEPFLKTEPETTEDKEIVTQISGRVELDHVTFRYTEDGPDIIKDMSLRIKAGEYVAIVGKTGCGKSTLIRLLLGFEKPDKGAVYYDGKDIRSLDLASLRKKIGTVLQDAGLFQGDIYSNIVISAPELTQQDAWEAAAMAGIAEDIMAMPMQMNTVIAEGGGGISGGQRQRIMIARAIAPKPKLLLFDEATSALDNRTQKQVSESLDKMGCTRIVIAHRLSTIQHCDRIIVIDDGRIIEEGTYESLIEKGGFFADLVARQRLDTP